MGDRAYNTTPKPAMAAPPRLNGGVAPATNGGSAVRPPPAGPSRVPPPPAYRPKPYPPLPPPRRRGRGRSRSCCACCCWLILVVIGVIFLAAIAGCVFYVLYHPRSPSFAITSVRLAALNVSDSDTVTSRLDFTVTARNPNAKIAFDYGDIAVSVTADGADVGDGSIPGFVHAAGNTTVIKASVSTPGSTVDPVQAADLRTKKTHAMSVELDSKVGFQIGKFKSKPINVRVLCNRFNAGIAKPTPPPEVVAPASAPTPALAPSPSRETVAVEQISLAAAAAASAADGTTTDAKCKVRIKIWIWTF